MVDGMNREAWHVVQDYHRLRDWFGPGSLTVVHYSVAKGSSFFNKLSVCFNGIDRINDGTFDRNKNKNKAEMPAFRNSLVQTERIGHIKSLY